MQITHGIVQPWGHSRRAIQKLDHMRCEGVQQMLWVRGKQIAGCVKLQALRNALNGNDSWICSILVPFASRPPEPGPHTRAAKSL